MKQYLVILLAVGFTYGASINKSLNDNKGNALPVIDAKFQALTLSEDELDTGVYVFPVLDRPIRQNADTLGHAFLTCKDASGTDSVNILLIADGNSRSDGMGDWTAFDTVATQHASGSYVVTRGSIVNPGYAAIRFRLKNRMSNSANTSTCKDIGIVTRPWQE